MLIWGIASLWILQSPTQLSSKLIEWALISGTNTAGTKLGLLFCVAPTFTQTDTLTGVSVLTRDEFVGLWCAQVCWLGHSLNKGVLTWLGGFLRNPLLSSAYLIRCIISHDWQNYQKNINWQQKALSDACNKAHVYWPQCDLYECPKMAFGWGFDKTEACLCVVNTLSQVWTHRYAQGQNQQGLLHCIMGPCNSHYRQLMSAFITQCAEEILFW